MPTSVNLQPAFIHGLIPLLVLFLALVSPLFVGRKERKRQANLKKTNPGGQTIKPVPPDVRQSYVNKLARLNISYKESEKNSRECYQILSAYIRTFALEYAGIEVRNRTLAEIRAREIPQLEKLIEEYYACEFAPDVEGDVEKSIEETINVIYNW